MGKRLFDLFLAGLGLILLSPLFLVISIWIKLDSRGPVFFRGKRVGRERADFMIIKFRSMAADAALTGPELTSGDDQRITRAGRLLRLSKLDELPQLINVIRGEMSLVGPRPEVRRYVERFPEDYREILEIRPGITDLASLEYRDEASLLGKSRDPEACYLNEVLPEKIRLAKEYRLRSSVWYDLRLIGRTLAALAGQPAFLELFALASLILITAVAVIYPDSFISGGPMIGSWRMSPFTVLTPLVLLAGFVLLARGRRDLSFGKIDLILFGYMAYFLLRNISGGAFPGALKYVLYSLVAYYLCALLSRKPAFLRTIIVSIVALALLTALYGLFVEYILQRNILYRPYIIDSVRDPAAGIHRIGSTLAHPVAYGAFLIQTIPFCVYLGSSRQSPRLRIFGIISSGLAITALLFTFSKGSWLAAAIIGLAMTIVFVIRKGRRELLLLSGLAVFLALISLFFWSTLSTEFSSRADMSVQLRTFGWTAATDAIREQPLFGAGFHEGPVESYAKLEQPVRERIEVLSIDNSYLTLLLEEGAVGFVLWLAFLALALASGIRTVAAGSGGSRAPAMAALVSLIGCCLNAATFEAFFIWSNLILFWVSAGLLRGTGLPAINTLFANTDARA